MAVVEDHQLPVARRADIQLDAVSAFGQRLLERYQRIFRRSRARCMKQSRTGCARLRSCGDTPMPQSCGCDIGRCTRRTPIR